MARLRMAFLIFFCSLVYGETVYAGMCAGLFKSNSLIVGSWVEAKTRSDARDLDRLDVLRLKILLLDPTFFIEGELPGLAILRLQRLQMFESQAGSIRVLGESFHGFVESIVLPHFEGLKPKRRSRWSRKAHLPDDAEILDVLNGVLSSLGHVIKVSYTWQGYEPFHRDFAIESIAKAVSEAKVGLETRIRENPEIANAFERVETLLVPEVWAVRGETFESLVGELRELESSLLR